MDKKMILVVWFVVLCHLAGNIDCQATSKTAPECYNTATCPCCTVSCPSDGSGQCSGNCKDGYHGGKCYNKCPENCIRCTDAQQGGGVSNCTECKDGYYSTPKSYQCQNACRQYNCQKCNTQDCILCKDGYYLLPTRQCEKCPDECLQCNSSTLCTSCKTGFYLTGQNHCAACNSLCSSCVSDTSCVCSNGCSVYGNCTDNSTGQCKFGCKTGFSSTEKNRCDVCFSGNFGVECNKTCSSQCESNCSRISGECHACKSGLFGSFCNETCPRNCMKDCNKTTGICDKCKDNFYGPNCTKACPNMCKECHRENGTCLFCIDGMFGETCNQNCSENCIYGKCLKNNGSCECKTGYGGVNCKEILTTPTTTNGIAPVVTEDPKKYVIPAVSSTIAVIIVIGLLMAGIWWFKVRKTYKYRHYEIDPGCYSLDPSLIDILEENDEFDPTYFTGIADESKKPCGKLLIKDLSKFVEEHGDDFYKEEFLRLPRGLIKPHDEAKKPENVVKNRYTGIYPYDEHRVILSPPGSDFINACYIDGYNRKKEYIASLGPTRKAMEDFNLFWRMVWQEKTDVIVMVTNLMEGQSMKCEPYWPEPGTSCTFANIIVTSEKEENFAEFDVRTLSLKMGKEQRILHHLHYTAWPDKRVPDDVTSLIEFRQKVKATGSILGGPTIVHCSAGIGRTGTYIALDILIHQGKAQKSLDIFEWVARMREQRTSMVQTWEQYAYLHQALVHALTYRCDPIKEKKFSRFMDKTDEKKMTILFKQLHRKGEKITVSEQEARDTNRGYNDMNRDGADIPGNQHRPYLHLGKRYGESNYINAVFINSYKEKQRFLVCQTPLPDTVKDFLTLIMQESCSCIVCMDPPGLRDQTVGVYYPAQAGKMYTHPSHLFDVEAQEMETNKTYVLRKLTIHFAQSNNTISRTVYHFQCQHWSQGNRVPDVSHFLQLVQDVEALVDRDSSHGPVLVHCLNAAERSGLFCAVSNLVQKMKLEGEISVVNTLRQVKVRRPLAIPNKDQYLFCYQCILHYVRQTDEDGHAIYGNV